jgi:hypothetical protein
MRQPATYTLTLESLPFATYKALLILASNPTFPTLLAFLEKRRGHYLWKAWCPYCRRYHIHGGGDLTDDPFRHLGHRCAHCAEGSPLRKTGYILVFGGFWDALTPKQKRWGPSKIEGVHHDG